MLQPRNNCEKDEEPFDPFGITTPDGDADGDSRHEPLLLLLLLLPRGPGCKDISSLGLWGLGNVKLRLS